VALHPRNREFVDVFDKIPQDDTIHHHKEASFNKIGPVFHDSKRQHSNKKPCAANNYHSKGVILIEGYRFRGIWDYNNIEKHEEAQVKKAFPKEVRVVLLLLILLI